MGEQVQTVKSQVEELRRRLVEAEEALAAIRAEQVDGLVVSSSGGDRVYTSEGADRTYRILIERMNEGALMLTADGIVLYANHRFAAMVGVPLGKIVSASFCGLVESDHLSTCEALKEHVAAGGKAELELRHADGSRVPALVSVSGVDLGGVFRVFAVVADLTAQKASERELREARDFLENHVQERVAALEVVNHDLQKEIRERRRAEEALVQSQEHLRTVVMHMPAMMIAFDRGGVIVAWNDECARVTGYTAEEIVGNPFAMELLYPDSTYLRSRMVEWERRGHDYRNWEWELRCKSGETRTVAWSNMSGRFRVAGWDSWSIGVDVTERKATEAERERLLKDAETARREAESWAAALAQSQALYRAIGETIPYGIWICDPAGGAEYLSECFLELIGRTLDECRGYGWVSALHPDDIAPMRAAWEGCRARGDLWRWEHRIRGTDGQYRTVVSRGIPIRDDQGRVRHWAGVNLDLTAEKETETRLQESEERFRQLAENINAAFWIKDRSAEGLLYGSPGFQSLWQCEPEPLMERFEGYLNHVHPDDRGRIEAAHRRMADGLEHGNPTFEEEYRIVWPDGTVRWMLSRAFPVRDKSGRAYRVAGITEDITAMKEAEEQLRRYSEELEALVEQRTRRIRQLEHQRASVEHLAAAGRMAARVAHEINNPLAGIKNAFLLVKEAVPDEHRYARYVPRIEQEIDRIAAIVRQMFELCRPAEGGEDFVPAGQALEETVAIHELTNQAKGVLFDLDVEPDCVDARLPGHSLRQILHNLIQNAVDASPPNGRVRISVSAAEGGRVRFSVRDEGPGIPAERQPFIFQPFYTTKSAHRESGLGLGLSICRALVDSVGGHIGYTTAEGSGTTFNVEIPAALD